jgi:hypothetical protein
VLQRAKGKAPWIKFLERDQICNIFCGKGCPKVINALQTHGDLDLGDFFFFKRYGQLMGWSTLVDIDHDVLDFGYDILDKTRKTWKKIKTNPETKCEMTW